MFQIPHELLYLILDRALIDVSTKRSLCATCDIFRCITYEIMAERADSLRSKCNLWFHYMNRDIFTSCTQKKSTLIQILKKINLYRPGLKCYLISDKLLRMHLNFNISYLAMQFGSNYQLMIRVDDKKSSQKHKIKLL